MMQLTINISNEQLFDKILWLLNSFKNDGLEIINHNFQNDYKQSENKKLKQFENLLNTKSKNAITLDKNNILNPHNELSNDIS